MGSPFVSIDLGDWLGTMMAGKSDIFLSAETKSFISSSPVIEQYKERFSSIILAYNILM